MNNLKKAYELGWIQASKWAKREDLIADIGSPAYVLEAEAALATHQTQAEDYKTWYDEAMCASNEAGFAGVSAGDTIRELVHELAALSRSLANLDAESERLRERLEEAEAALAGHQTQAALKQSQAEPLESLLSTATGLLAGYADGKRVRKPYKPGSATANFVDECVERLKDWPPRAFTQQSRATTAQADSVPEQQTKKGTP